MFISKQRRGNTIYVYEVTAYRNEEGKPRNRKKVIGKIDPETGEMIPTREYKKKDATNE